MSASRTKRGSSSGESVPITTAAGCARNNRRNARSSRSPSPLPCWCATVHPRAMRRAGRAPPVPNNHRAAVLENPSTLRIVSVRSAACKSAAPCGPSTGTKRVFARPGWGARANTATAGSCCADVPVTLEHFGKALARLRGSREPSRAPSRPHRSEAQMKSCSSAVASLILEVRRREKRNSSPVRTPFTTAETSFSGTRTVR
jgi:hypothetical protein